MLCGAEEVKFFPIYTALVPLVKREVAILDEEMTSCLNS